MRWSLVFLIGVALLSLGAARQSPRILAWLHLPKPQKVQKLLSEENLFKGHNAFSVVVSPSLEHQLDFSESSFSKFSHFQRLSKTSRRNTLAFGYLDFMPLYAHFSQDRNASRNAALAVRLGIDELEGLDSELAESKSEILFSSSLRYKGKKEGLLAVLGEPIPLPLPHSLSSRLVGYSTFSVVPAQLYWTAIRAANYLWSLPASLAQLQLRGLESQMNKLMDIDILGEASQSWELVEMKMATGELVGILRAEIRDPRAFEVWLRLFEPILPLIGPTLALERFSRGKKRGYKLLGAGVPLAFAVEQRAVVVAPSPRAIREFSRIRSKRGLMKSKMGVARGLRASADQGVSRLGRWVHPESLGLLGKILEYLQGVSWVMADEPNALTLTGKAKWSRGK